MKKIIEKIDDAYWACHRFIRDYIFEPVWYRFFGHKHHIVKTKLTPAPWYDTDTRILYSVMELVVWFVENDMRTFTVEEYQDEIDRIYKEDDEECQEGNIKGWQEQYERDQEIIEISNWWKNYPNRCKEKDASLHEWSRYISSVSGEGFDNFLEFLNSKDKLSKKELAEEERLNKIHRDQEKKLEDEEQEYLKKAIDLRKHMWS